MSDDELTNIDNATWKLLVIHLKNSVFEECWWRGMRVPSWVWHDGGHGGGGRLHARSRSGGGRSDGGCGASQVHAA